jgi:hypothetical protein
MSVVVFGLLMQKFPQAWFAAVAMCCIFLVGFSRVYSCARFPHQVVGSWIAGFIGLQTVGRLVRDHMKIEKMVRPHQWWLVGMAVMAGLIHLALCVENNDSRLAHVPKAEFTRVVVDIMNGTTTPADANVSTVRNSDGTLRRVRRPQRADNTGVLPDGGAVVTPRSAMIREAAQQLQQRQPGSSKYYDRVRRDSFYHMQRGMMMRDARRKGGEGGSSLLGEEDFNYMASPAGSPRGLGGGGDSFRDSFRNYRTARSSGSSRGRSERASRAPAAAGGSPSVYASGGTTGTTPRV